MVEIGLEGKEVVIRGVKEVDSTLDKTGKTGTGAFGSVKDALQGFLGPAGAAVSGLKDIAETAFSAGRFLFGMVEHAADIGSKIHDIGQQANLTAETISVMKAAAEGGGSSLEETGPKLAKFTAGLVAAANGNKELSGALQRFDIDAKTAFQNPDAALSQFITKFNELPASSQKNADAMKIFKDKTGSIIPVIEQVDGSFEDYKKHLQSLGLVMSQEAADAADRFGDQLTELREVAEGAGISFGSVVAPAITGAMRDIEKSLVDNRGALHAWAQDVVAATEFVRVMLRATERMISREGVTPDMWGSDIIRDEKAKVQREDRDVLTVMEMESVGREQARRFRTSQSGAMGSGGSGSGSGADTAYQKAINAAKETAQAIIESVQSETTELARQYQRQTIDLEEYVAQSQALIRRRRDALFNQAEEDQVSVARFSKRSYAGKKQLVQEFINAGAKADRDAAAATLALQDRTESERLNRYRASAQQMDALRSESEQRRNAAAQYSAERWAESMVAASRIMNDAEAEAFRNRSRLEQATFEEAAKLANRFALDSIERQRNQLDHEMAIVTGAAEVNVAEYTRILNALALLAEREKSIRAQGQRGVEEGQRRDHQIRVEAEDSAQQHAAKMAQLAEDVAVSEAALARQRTEDTLRSAGPFSKARRAALDANAAADLLEIEQRRLQNRRALISSREALLRETSDQEERLRVRKQYNQLLADEDERADRERRIRERQRDRDKALSGPMGGFDIGMSTGQIVQGMQRMEDGTYQFAGAATIALSAVGAVVNGLAQAVGNLVENWVLMGNTGEQSFAKITATILANLARQAATQAIMFTAYGIAALTPWGRAIYGEPAIWFKAAAVMATVAVTAGAAGRAVAGNNFNGKGNAAGAAPDYSQFGQVGFSGNQSIRLADRQIGSSERDSHTAALARAVEKLQDKIDKMSPGDVVVRGMDQRPRAVGAALDKDLASNPTLQGKLARKIPRAA